MTLHLSRFSPAAGPAATSRFFRRAAAAAIIAAAAVSTAGTAQAAAAGLTLSNQWIRLIIPSRPAGGYFTLSNATDKTRALVSASSPGCDKVMLHRSIHESGRDRMVAVENVPVPAHGTLKFAPGGYHLMCMSPTDILRPGKSVPVTLTFDDGSDLTADFPVRGINMRK